MLCIGEPTVGETKLSWKFDLSGVAHLVRGPEPRAQFETRARSVPDFELDGIFRVFSFNSSLITSRGRLSATRTECFATTEQPVQAASIGAN